MKKQSKKNWYDVYRKKGKRMVKINFKKMFLHEDLDIEKLQKILGYTKDGILYMLKRSTMKLKTFNILKEKGIKDIEKYIIK